MDWLDFVGFTAAVFPSFILSMTSQPPDKQSSSKDIKQVILLLVSVAVVSIVSLPLFQSLSAPQVQGRLELAQSALVLQAAEVQPGGSEQQLLDQLLRGGDAQVSALEQYRSAITKAEENLTLLEQRQDALVTSEQDEAAAALAGDVRRQRVELRQLRLEGGILAATQEDIALAEEFWQQAQLDVRDQAVLSDAASGKGERSALEQAALIDLPPVLTGLWADPPRLLPTVERSLRDGLTGWFRDESLERLFTLDQRMDELATLQSARHAKAESSLMRLGIVSLIPGLGVVLGSILWVILGIFAGVRRGKESSPVALQAWSVPWSGITVWFGVTLGFFLVGQLGVSAIAGTVIAGVIQSVEPVNMVRAQAIGVFFSYGAMAIAVLTALYFLLRQYLPLGKDWFRFSLKEGNWLAWGVGGYLMAYPPVLLVSVLNAQIWQGKGGSNPLLSLALENRDNVALLFFFVTAAIAAPVFEEIFFRGFLMTSLTKFLPSWGAVVVSGGIFALVHLSFSEVLPLMTLGIMLGFVYGRSRNLLASIVLHGLWNSGTLISLFLLGGALS